MNFTGYILEQEVKIIDMWCSILKLLLLKYSRQEWF